MRSIISSAVVAAGLFTARTALAEVISTEVGAAGFLFPTEREYSASADTTAPCGSIAQVGNRTMFPLTGGFVGLVDQEEAYFVSVSISYSVNPTSLDQFDTLIASTAIKDLYEGHTCVSIPNPPSNVSVGDVATLQVAFESVWDGSTVNETYYACADIVYILDADFTENSYCFNATIGEPSSTATSTGAAATSTGTGSSGSGSSSDTSGSSGSSSSSSSKISKGAIAGAVVGSVVGAALIAGALMFVYRLGKKHQREAMMRVHMNTMALGDMGKPAATGSQASNY